MVLTRNGHMISARGCLRPPGGGFYSPTTVVVLAPNGALHEVEGVKVGPSMKWVIPLELQDQDVVTVYYKGWEDCSTTALSREGRFAAVQLLLRSETRRGTVLHCHMKTNYRGDNVADAPYIKIAPTDTKTIYQIAHDMIGNHVSLETITKKAIICHKASKIPGQPTGLVDLYIPEEVHTQWTPVLMADIRSGRALCDYYLDSTIGELSPIASSGPVASEDEQEGSVASEDEQEGSVASEDTHEDREEHEDQKGDGGIQMWFD